MTKKSIEDILENVPKQRAGDLKRISPTIPKGSKVYKERYMKRLKKNWRTLIIRAGMGSGKTKVLIDYINKYKPKRILFITSRQDFARSIMSRLGEEFVMYLDIPKNLPLDQDKIVVQLESLMRIGVDFRLFDLVILDESESILKQFSSETMLDKKDIIYSVLEEIVTNSKRVIAMDAFITERTVSYLKSTREGKIKNIVNTYKSDEKKSAVDLVSWNNFEGVFLNLVENDKKIYSWFASNSKAKRIYKLLKEKYPEKNILLYTSDTGDATKKALSNVNEVWSNADVVITTPTITVGISFDIEHFDNCLIYGSSYSCCVRDVMQATQRVRKFKDPNIYYHIFMKPNLKQIRMDTIWMIRRNLEANNKRLDSFVETMDSGMDVLRKLSGITLTNDTYNILENQMSWYYYKIVFEYYLQFLGFELSEIEGNMKVEKVDIDVEVKYKDIKLVTGLSEIRDRIFTKNATEEEKLEWNKRLFLNHIKTDVEEEVRGRIYDSIWNKVSKRKYILNAKTELGKNAVNPFVSKKETKDIRTLEKLSILKKLCSPLNLRNTLDSSVEISHEKLLLCSVTEIDASAFGCRPGKKIKQIGYVDVRTKTELINKIFGEWTGSKIKGIRRVTTSCNDGCKKQVLVYKLESIDPLFYISLKL